MSSCKDFKVFLDHFSSLNLNHVFSDDIDDIDEEKGIHEIDNHCAVVCGEGGSFIHSLGLDVVEEVSAVVECFLLKYPKNEKAIYWKQIIDARLVDKFFLDKFRCQSVGFLYYGRGRGTSGRTKPIKNLSRISGYSGFNGLC